VAGHESLHLKWRGWDRPFGGRPATAAPPLGDMRTA